MTIYFDIMAKTYEEERKQRRKLWKAALKTAVLFAVIIATTYAAFRWL